MKEGTLYPAGKTAAITYACQYLKDRGVAIASQPDAHVAHILLDVPSFSADGDLRCGGRLEALLGQVPGDVTVFGGNLADMEQVRCVDLLKDPLYQAENAYITAEAALEIAATRLPRTIRDCPVLIIGWGRIGKCLARLLSAWDANVTIAARKSADRAMCQALGYSAGELPYLIPQLDRFRLIFNTVPTPLLTREQLMQCDRQCVKIELASKNGLIGKDVIIARGLPGVHKPESSGELIARTYLRLRKEV